MLKIFSKTKISIGPNSPFVEESPVLHILISSSLHVTVHNLCFLTEQKISNVTPAGVKVMQEIYKSVASNYRWISLLSIHSKLVERLSIILSLRQFGHAGSSMLEALLSVTHCWHCGLDRLQSSVALFLDMSMQSP